MRCNCNESLSSWLQVVIPGSTCEDVAYIERMFSDR
jgi:hypothetical protein